MQITSKSGKVYEMKWRLYGFSWAEPIALTKKTYFRIFTITHRQSLIHWARSMMYFEAESAKPDKLRKWFTDTVNNYEDYQEAWKKYQKEQLCKPLSTI